MLWSHLASATALLALKSTVSALPAQQIARDENPKAPVHLGPVKISDGINGGNTTDLSNLELKTQSRFSYADTSGE